MSDKWGIYAITRVQCVLDYLMLHQLQNVMISVLFFRLKGGKSRSSGQGQGKVGSGPSKHSKGEKGDKCDKDKSRHGRGILSFHRRGATMDDMFTSDIDFMVHRMPPPQANFKAPVGAAGPHPPVGQTVGAAGTTHLDAPADSPHSAAPSPLVAPQVPPSVTHGNGDPTMPTLSPHPPSKNTEKDLNSSIGLGSEHHQEVTTNGLGPALASQPGQPGEGLAKLKLDTYHTSVSAPVDTAMTESVNKWLESQHVRQAETHSLKRPILPTKDWGASEELVTDELYNFDSLHTW